MGVLGRADSEGIKKLNYQAWGHGFMACGLREIGVMAAHMHAETVTAEQAPLSEKTKRRAACQPEIRTQREQASESMCECSMGEVRWANAVHVKLDLWTQAFLAQAHGQDMRDEPGRNESGRSGRSSSWAGCSGFSNSIGVATTRS